MWWDVRVCTYKQALTKFLRVFGFVLVVIAIHKKKTSWLHFVMTV